MAKKKKSTKHGKRRKPSKSGKSSRKKKALKKAAPKQKSSAAKTIHERRIREKREVVDSVEFQSRGLGARSGGQAGDPEGLSGVEGAESESVEELLEEGNAFEADIVKGVQDADDADESEVKTKEVPEDDVPEEYLDEK